MIYLVEDDDSIRELVVYTLQSVGMDAAGFSLPSDFWCAMEDQTPSLILLDIMLPEQDGLEILQKLKDNPKTAPIPVIMLTAKGEEYDQVKGLDLGADDYIPKPFGMMALTARIKAVLRRYETEEKHDVLRAGEVVLDKTQHTVKAGGKAVTLTLKEYELLQYLMEHPRTVFTRDQLLDAVWGYTFDGESRTVDVHIRHLRQKLSPYDRILETVRGLGYRLGEETV